MIQGIRIRYGSEPWGYISSLQPKTLEQARSKPVQAKEVNLSFATVNCKGPCLHEDRITRAVASALGEDQNRVESFLYDKSLKYYVVVYLML